MCGSRLTAICSQTCVQSKKRLLLRETSVSVPIAARTATEALMFSRIVIPVGSCIKEHPHNPEAEIYYILEGEVEVTDNGAKAILHGGDVVFTGGGDTHSIKNIGTTDAVFMAVILK